MIRDGRRDVGRVVLVGGESTGLHAQNESSDERRSRSRVRIVLRDRRCVTEHIRRLKSIEERWLGYGGYQPVPPRLLIFGD